VLQHLEAADGHAELFACLEVFQCQLMQRAHRAHSLRTQGRNGDGGNAVDQIRPAIRLAEHRARGKLHAGQAHRRRALPILCRDTAPGTPAVAGSTRNSVIAIAIRAFFR